MSSKRLLPQAGYGLVNPAPNNLAKGITLPYSILDKHPLWLRLSRRLR